ncbi:MAG TPA: ABC transporter permease [Bryobacteraceae bacterium]|nr:ABC transporter permease [Bryobacteraceae bacterium]
MPLAQWTYKLPLRVRSLFRRGRVELELDEELRFHVQCQTEANIVKGLPPEEARYAALRSVGNTALISEQTRDCWGWTLLNGVLQDVRYACRLLARSPAFTLTAILTLALGIGASTAVFSVLDSVVLQPLAFRDSGKLVALWERVAFLGPDTLGPNPRHVDVWSKRGNSFQQIAILRYGAIGVATGSDHPHVVGTVMSTPNLFEVLQVQPLLGRTLRHSDGVPGQDTAAVLTYGTWQSLFAGDPNIIGKSIRLGDIPREIVGVLPPGFHFPNRNTLRPFTSKQKLVDVPEPAIFVPAAVKLTDFSWNGEYGNWIALARLKPAATVASAQAELTAIQTQLMREIPGRGRTGSHDWLQASVQPMQEAMVANSRRILWFLMAAVLGLMLIACVNLANTQLARMFWRQRETSVRTALGAPKWRLMWNALVENLLIAMVAGVAGVILAALVLESLKQQAGIDLPRLAEVRLNPGVLVFASALTLVTTFLVSVIPTLYFLRSDPQRTLQQASGRAKANRHSRGLHRVLVTVQVFGCTALLFVTGLFSKNLLQLSNQEIGFRTTGAAFAQVNLSGASYGSHQSRVAFIDGVLEKLRTIPGVESAGYISAAPLEGESWLEPLERRDKAVENAPLVNARWTSPGYFEAMGHKLIAGRFLDGRDRETGGVVISEAEAKALWPNEDPIGSAVQFIGRQLTVVGVVGDSRSTSLKAPPSRLAWVHYVHRTPATLFFIARARQSGDMLAAAMRDAIWSYAPAVAIARARSLDSQVNQSLAPERFQTAVITGFGASALLIAMLGIYGVLSYSVATRRQEIGVRMAVGATPGRIYSLTLREVGLPVMIGLAAGLAAILVTGRLLNTLLYGMQGIDGTVVGGVTILFLISSLLAAFLPARQAASVHPMEALRSE